MSTVIQAFLDYEIKDIVEAFSNNIQTIQVLLNDESKLLLGDDKEKTERLPSIFEDIFEKSIEKHHELGIDFVEAYNQVVDTYLSNGISFEELVVLNTE